MMEVEHIEEFLDDNVDEGRRDRNNDNNNNQQNINGLPLNHHLSGNRPLFTTILVIYWLYYLCWFVMGIIFSFFSQNGGNDINIGISIICMILPSLIMLILMSRISCLNSLNINNINHYQNLNENAKQKYKLMSILITILLMFGGLLRVIWWIYFIIEYPRNDQHLLKVAFATILINEFGVILLINIDYIKMSYFEKNRLKQGVFGIVNDPYPCLVSLSILVSIQLWILTYGHFKYKSEEIPCTDSLSYIVCGLHIIYLISAMITMIIPIAFMIKKFKTSKQNNHNRS